MKEFYLAVITTFIAILTSTMIRTRKAIDRAEELHTTSTQMVDQSDEPDTWPLFIDALIEVESSGRDTVTGDGGKAVGCLQIHPVTVDECNRILGREEFTLADRLSRERSIEMFNVIQGEHNPDHDLHLALVVWNSRGGLRYHRKVMEIYNLKTNNL